MSNPGEELLTEEETEEAPQPEEEAPEMTMEADVAPVDARVVVVAKKVRVYRAPSFDADMVGGMKRGDEAKVFAVDGVNVWVRIGPGQWVPFVAKGKRYLEMAED